MIIYILGNSLSDIDSLPLTILPLLQKQFSDISFVSFDPTEELPEPIPNPLIIIDTVLGIDTIQVYRNMDSFLLSPQVTAHDFDLPLFLGMLKKLKKIKDICIIGVPPNISRSTAVENIALVIIQLRTVLHSS